MRKVEIFEGSSEQVYTAMGKWLKKEGKRIDIVKTDIVPVSSGRVMSYIHYREIKETENV